MSTSGTLAPLSKVDTRKIKAIQFGILSPQMIEKMSVIHENEENVYINNPRSFDENGEPTENGINDLRMGTTDRKLHCKTCNCDTKNCPGHFGHIKLAKPVYHIGFINECLKILKCVCFNCSRILIDDIKKYIEIKKIKNPKARQLKIYNYTKSKDKIVCKKFKDEDKEKIKKQIEDNTLKNISEDDLDLFFKKEGCDFKQPKYKKEGHLEIIVEFPNSGNNNEENRRVLSPEKVLSIFSQITDDDCKLLGFDPKISRPNWMIIQSLAVCPPQVRPSVSVDSSLRSQDDLTHQYNEIIKKNNELNSQTSRSGTNTTISNSFNALQGLVANLMNNDIAPIRSEKKNKQPIKAIYARLKGKEGRVRGNLMGKRVDFSARSVISPDPNLDVDELGVPLSIAMNLTFPETVTDLNIERLKKLVNNGAEKWPGAKRIIFNDGKTIIDLRHCKNRTDEHLEKGYIVERHIQNGDYVIFNRQPSLHKMSMMGHRVHILPYSTFRLNLSVTTPYNADFDGDEMNMHLPQSYETKSEIMNIMHVPKQIVSPQSNRPVMGIVQDTLIGVKLFTSRDNFLDYEQMMNLVFWINDFDIRNLPMPCIMKPKPLWSGKQIFSLILPKKINLKRKREDDPEGSKLNLIDNYVQISKGELVQGIICKKTVGASPGGIIHCIWMEVSPQKTIEFLSNCQKIVNNWLLLSGWTVGVSDIICDKETSDKIKDTLIKMKHKLEELLMNAQIGKLETQPGKNTEESFESHANTELNSATNTAGKIVQNALGPKNHLKNMVSAGSKGSVTNISQIIAFCGQQNVDGKRIPFLFQRRTLPHFLRDDYKSESKGFVENSFLKGLTPQEFYFHAMGGREGIIDTAVKTSQTGYIQRRLVKALEDIMIKYDGTVRNSLGQLVQFLYGEDGMAGEYIEGQKFETLKMDDAKLEYYYKFIEINEDDPELTEKFFNEMSSFMEESVINELRNERFSTLRKELNEEFEGIKNDRDILRKTILKTGTDDIYIPINVSRIIINAKSEFNINDYSKSDLNPILVISKVKELKKDLILIKGDDPISIEGQECSISLLNKFLNYNLSTKKLIKFDRLNTKAFDYIYGEIKSKFYQALVRPGEMVGSIAAQSIGEPATQMTLNTFHLAGVSAANVTLGVPRLNEVINLAKTPKTPLMTTYILPGYITEAKDDDKSDEEKIKKQQESEDLLKFKIKIEKTTLLNVLNKSEIYYDPDIKNTIINADRDWVDLNLEFYSDIDEKNISPWLLRLEFNSQSMINRHINDIKKIIKNKRPGILIFGTTDTAETKVLHIRLTTTEDERHSASALTLDAIKNFENILLTEVFLSGINSVNQVYSKKVNKIIYTDKGEINTKDKKEWFIQTDGSNLKKIFEIDGIDFKRTNSNDLNEIFDVLGIEAVRKSLVNEIRNIWKSYDIYVNYRHVSILADLMTQKGFLTSITRHGLNRAEFGPIRKASFEETVEILLEAGMFAEKDELKGISENILLGNLTNIGTGNFDILLDLEPLYRTYNEDPNNNDDQNSEEIFINSPMNDDTNNLNYTPYQGNTPNAMGGRGNNITFSTYENNPASFTPGYNSIQSPYGGGANSSVYRGDSSFIATPNPNANNIQPSSPEYNPSSDYYKTPAPYSPIPEDNRVNSEYNSSYSPINVRSPALQTGSMYGGGRRPIMETATPKSTYSPTTPAIRPSSNSPQYLQGSGLYSTTPIVQDSSGGSQYTPASPNYCPLSPNYMNRGMLTNSSPFYNPNANNPIKEDENEDDEDDDEQKQDNSHKDDDDKE